MSTRVLRKRHRTKGINRPTAALSFTIRAGTPIGLGAHAPYSVAVTDGGIDRSAWAALVSDLIKSETRGKKAPFARLVGVDARTLDRWLRHEVDVREESVRAVARALDRSPMDLLVQVGYYRPGEVAPPRPVDPHDDPVIQMIMTDPRWTDDERTALVDREIERMRREQERRIEDYVLYLRQQREERREERGTA